MGKVFEIKAGQPTRVLWLYSSSVPGTARFRVEAMDGGPAPSGTVELARRRWFEWHRESHPLTARHVFDKGMMDTDYRITITPDRDCRVIFETWHFRAELFFRILAGVIITGVVAALSVMLFADPPPR
ncbi:MAG: hypothetical protein AAGB15_12025 [Pseudomonadota bacterium]